MKTGNELIAEYMPKSGVFYIDPTNGVTLCEAKDLEYHDKIEWLYPVYLKLRKELIEKEDGFQTHEQYYRFNATYVRRSAIEVALIQGDIAELHAEIVKGITFLNEQKK